MCVVSMISDHYRDKWREPYQPFINPIQPFYDPNVVFPQFKQAVTQQEFDALKKEFISEQFIQKLADKIIELLPNKTPSKTPKKKTIEELSKNPIKLNTASKDDLETVPGIGPQKASDIIHRIKTKGKFQNINELAEIKITGISSNTIQKWDKCFDLS